MEIEITKAELEEKFFSVRLTIVDTPGFGDYVNSKEAWAPIVEFLDDQVQIPQLSRPLRPSLVAFMLMGTA